VPQSNDDEAKDCGDASDYQNHEREDHPHSATLLSRRRLSNTEEIDEEARYEFNQAQNRFS
jgi:hypothetical protein